MFCEKENSHLFNYFHDVVYHKHMIEISGGGSMYMDFGCLYQQCFLWLQ